MKQHIPNTFNLPATACEVITVTSIDQLMVCYNDAANKHLPILVLGQGSNTLFTEDFNGIVILNRITGISVKDDPDFWLLRVGAGEVWHHMIQFTVENNIPGLENLALIPGCVGSAPIQNIGAYGIEFEKVADYVELLELDTGKIITVTDGQYGYRDSVFKSRYLDGYVVVNVGIKLTKQWRPTLSYGELTQFDANTVSAKMIFDKVCEIRGTKLPDPNVLGNGEVSSKNPVIDQSKVDYLLQQYPNMPMYHQANGQVKLAAGWLIDQCGLKGYQIGGAAVHDKQALVLVNKKNASAQDIVDLARHIRNTVRQRFDITLSSEIRFMGDHGEINSDLLLSQ